MTQATYVFDLFGTLVDYATLRDAVADIAADPDAFVLAWRQKQVAYTFAATLMERYVDFDAITANAFDYVAASHGRMPSAERRAHALAAWSRLPAFGDALTTLAALHERGVRTAVLSNGTPAAINAIVAACGLAPHLDAVLSVDAVRKYKPHPAVYALATQHFAALPGDVGFVSSNGWDASGAAAFGFRVTWCNRAGLPAETFGPAAHRTIATLAELLHE